MCGITGYVGKNNAIDFLISGLEKLEYRGYDSAGICVVDGSNLKYFKSKGKVDALKQKVLSTKISGKAGIGHTRWATHGLPDDVNAHPHLSNDKKFAVVHNGIIENYSELRRKLKDRGFEFFSQTDTEVIPNLIQYFYNGDVFDAFAEAVNCLEGSYALGVVSVHQPDTLFAVRKDSPLIIGLGNDENFITSDLSAVLKNTKSAYILDSGEFAIVTPKSVRITDKHKNTIKKEVFEATWDADAAEKGNYEFYMLKEIMEQPEVIKNTILPRLKNGEIDLSETSFDKEYLKKLEKVHIIACGSAYHAGLYGKNLIESMAKTQVNVEVASEFRYKNPILNKDDLVIAISQSGETSDTLAALKFAKEKGAKVLSIVNVKGSSIARESDDVLYTNAGPEISVATTKAYLAQIFILVLFALFLSKIKQTIPKEEYNNFIDELYEIENKIEKILSHKAQISDLAKKFQEEKSAFFIGRGFDHAVSMEGSLKLKEISYIFSESYPAGELKHGTISLIEDKTLVVALCTQKRLYNKMVSNIKEVKARGACVFAIATEDMQEIKEVTDHQFFIPKTNEYLAPVLGAIPLQMFAYFISLHKGLDVDKPKNLAKSVTVE